MDQQLKRHELVEWLRSIAGATILSVSLVGQVADLETNITDPLKLARALEQRVEFLGEGPYLVQYSPGPDQSGSDPSLPYTSFAMAGTLKAEFNHHPGSYVGGYDALVRELSGFEYLAKIGEGPSGPMGHLLILIPQNPSELSQLRSVLARYSVYYAFPDETGTLNVANLKMGQGLRV
ncbi:hypothetical protein [Marinobacter shengliensis]|uniref:hypothetical protein n=1 Tax=Marinobacter shengliensis TaxID=1389223 RepID=UPI001109C91C|nr:hypothetical protein [Marinobacter shengliensis]